METPKWVHYDARWRGFHPSVCDSTVTIIDLTTFVIYDQACSSRPLWPAAPPVTCDLCEALRMTYVGIYLWPKFIVYNLLVSRQCTLTAFKEDPLLTSQRDVAFGDAPWLHCVRLLRCQSSLLGSQSYLRIESSMPGSQSYLRIELSLLQWLMAHNLISGSSHRCLAHNLISENWVIAARLTILSHRIVSPLHGSQS